MSNSEESKRGDADADPGMAAEEAEAEDEAPSEDVTKGPYDLTFDHYLGGGAIGFSVAMLLMVALEWLFENAGWELTVPLRIAFSLVPSLIGAASAAFLFIRKSRTNYLADGFKIGVAGFIITFLYTMLFQVSVGGAYIMVGFFMGGSLGGLVAKSVSIKG